MPYHLGHCVPMFNDGEPRKLMATITIFYDKDTDEQREVFLGASLEACAAKMISWFRGLVDDEQATSDFIEAIQPALEKFVLVPINGFEVYKEWDFSEPDNAFRLYFINCYEPGG